MGVSLHLALLALACACSPSGKAPPVLTAWVLRHAEKRPGEDPQLTEQGARRAQALADQLKDEPLRAVYSSEYHRTRETVRPTATAHGLELTSYDPRGDLASLLLERHLGQAVLVAGHSNTVPGLLGDLGMSEPPVIDEQRYGDLWRVTRSGERTTVQALRFGESQP